MVSLIFFVLYRYNTKIKRRGLGSESPKREFVEFLEYINDRVSDLISDAPTLNREAAVILQNQRLEVPSPFDHIEGLNERRLNIEVEESAI